MNVGLFVDVSNLYYYIRRKYNGRKLDYRKFMERVSNGHLIYKSIAYGVQLGTQTHDFITFLRAIGFDTKYKEPSLNTEILNKDEVDLKEMLILNNDLFAKKEFMKTDWRVTFVIDVIRYLDRLDIVILGSSDVNLIPLVQYIQQKGLRCKIAACGIPNELRLVADSSIEIDESFLEAVSNGTDLKLSSGPS